MPCPTQHNGIGAVYTNIRGITGVTKDGAMLVVLLLGLTGMPQVATCLLLKFCGATN